MQRYKEFRPSPFDSKGLLGEHHRISDWFVMPCSRTRDSGPIDESNFAAALDMLGGESDDVQVHRFGHWGTGWCEIILVNPDAVQVMQIANHIEEKLDDYPLLDEDDVSEREWEAVNEYFDQLTIAEKMEACQESGECIFAARAGTFDDFRKRASEAAMRIEDSGRE